MQRGILAVWCDVEAAAEADYSAWYEREHLFDRLAVPGFRRGRHYVTVAGAPRYFTYFVTDDAAVMASPAYLAAADRPSPWTRRILPHFRSTNRTACEVVRRVGRGSGAAALTIRLALPPDAGPATGAHLVAAVGGSLPALVERPGVVAAQIWRADLGATLRPVADRDLRPEPDATADAVVFVEGTAVEPLAELAEGPLAAARLAAAGASRAPEIALHRLLNEAGADEPPSI